MPDQVDYQLEMARSAARHDPDWFLQTFVSMANKSDITVGVTLLVKGAVVTGQLIGGAEYFETFGRQFGAAVGMSDEEAAGLYKPIIEDMYSRQPETEEDSDDTPSDPGPGFIHLKNVRVCHGTSHVPENHDGILWRGKLAEVDGFILGELQSANA